MGKHSIEDSNRRIANTSKTLERDFNRTKPRVLLKRAIYMYTEIPGAIEQTEDKKYRTDVSKTNVNEN